jgi:hypothetical protein
LVIKASNSRAKAQIPQAVGFASGAKQKLEVVYKNLSCIDIKIWIRPTHNRKIFRASSFITSSRQGSENLLLINILEEEDLNNAMIHPLDLEHSISKDTQLKWVKSCPDAVTL